jgi:hypothetical protein
MVTDENSLRPAIARELDLMSDCHPGVAEIGADDVITDLITIDGTARVSHRCELVVACTQDRFRHSRVRHPLVTQSAEDPHLLSSTAATVSMAPQFDGRPSWDVRQSGHREAKPAPLWLRPQLLRDGVEDALRVSV